MSVVCGPAKLEPDDRNTVVNPIVLVEVLGDSTEAYDRGDKLADHMKIPELREVLLVSHREMLIEIHRRTKDEWERLEARTHGIARLESIGCSLEVDEIYAGIELHRGG